MIIIGISLRSETKVKLNSYTFGTREFLIVYTSLNWIKEID